MLQELHIWEISRDNFDLKLTVCYMCGIIQNVIKRGLKSKLKYVFMKLLSLFYHHVYLGFVEILAACSDLPRKMACLVEGLMLSISASYTSCQPTYAIMI